uniref:Ig-like domain-containing protein n=1 Tax=Labrus bergylta TaxID=56723 RepID=A0A3Q3G8H7_9LABR
MPTFGSRAMPIVSGQCKGEDRVIQPTEDVFASEGDTVTLDCKVETTDTTLYLFWYRQEMGDFPKYLWKSYVGISENAPGISGDRFKATTNGTSVPLKIQKLQLTDSAVYYYQTAHQTYSYLFFTSVILIFSTLISMYVKENVGV